MNFFATHHAKPRSTVARSVKLIAAGVMILAGMTAAAVPTQAQSRDLPRAKVVEQLDAQYAETQVAVGVTREGGVIEVFATHDGSTWTLVLTKPDGTSRVVTAGQTWIKR